MAQFTDATGRKWELRLNVTTLRRVRELTGVNLYEAASSDVLARLARDPVLLCDVLYVLCKAQAEAAGISDAAFGELLAGDVLDQATKALLEEIVFFTPCPRDRETLRRYLQTAAAALEKGHEWVRAKLAELDPEKLLAEAHRTLNAASTNAPESSASTPGP